MTLYEAPLAATAEALGGDERELDSYLEELCDRIDAEDADIRALLPESDRRRRLLAEADRLREEHPDPDDRPPLFGVPVGVKDIIHASGFETRGGSAIPPEVITGPEAPVVTALREAGALVLGKTVTTEFAGQAPGHTRNPRNLDHTPGGSSSGSAAAVAAGMTPLALGTQTGGSVIRPAAFCGIVGLKPSLGRIPTAGVLTRSESIDHVGLFTQDVEGMILAASTVCEVWQPDEPDRRPTLGIPEGPYLERASAAAREALDQQAERLEASGYDVRRVDAFKNFKAMERRYRYLVDAELALSHSEWFDEYEPFYRAPSADRIHDGQAISTGELTSGRRGAREWRGRLHDAMDEAGIDLWICPAAPGPAPRGITDTGNPVMNFPWTYSGLPAATVPAGRVDGLPIGLQCVGRFGTDERLLPWVKTIHEAERGEASE